MKIKIEYKYEKSYTFPYTAFAKVDGDWYAGNSDKSFEKAEQDLIKSIKTKANIDVPSTPEPKEVEI